jgi:hypothetical protein
MAPASTEGDKRVRKPSAKAALNSSDKQERAAQVKAKGIGHKTCRATTNAVLVKAAKAGGKFVARVKTTTPAAGRGAGGSHGVQGPR